MTKFNQDNVTTDDIERTEVVLEAIRDSLTEHGLDEQAQTVEQTTYLLSEYVETYSRWESNKPSARIDPDEYVSLTDVVSEPPETE